MPSLQTCPAFTPAQMAEFQAQGYLMLKNALTQEQVDEIVERLDPLFNTQFETGIYPDEWSGRPGLSQPNATRQMTGMWRCDRTVAKYSLSGEIARLNAELMGWDGGRYGLDVCWIKPPNAPEVAFHRNNTYVEAINPSSIITCWIALSDCTAEAGTLEVVPASHHWNCTDTVRFLHAPRDDYRAPLVQAAEEAGVDSFEAIPIEMAPGSAVFLHGNLWHGSGRNRTENQTRRSFAVSTLPMQAEFRPPGMGKGYIFDRYRRMGRLDVDESYYPMLWRSDGYRTPFLADYCGEGWLGGETRFIASLRLSLIYLYSHLPMHSAYVCTNTSPC
ncbi:MAG: phytanoyl-CoA dioxygenase family protein [Cyanobacteria bacterium J06559_3]